VTEADAIADLKALWGKGAELWCAPADADYRRHLRAAELSLARQEPLQRLHPLTLVAGQAQYAAPADALAVLRLEWLDEARATRQPGNPDWPGRLPRAVLVVSAASRVVQVMPAPTAGQMAAFGGTCNVLLACAYHVDATDAAATTVPEVLRPLLLRHAVMAGMGELAARNVAVPIQLHRGMGSVPANSTPQAAFDALRRELLGAA
jgi:hypothetical protein